MPTSNLLGFTRIFEEGAPKIGAERLGGNFPDNAEIIFPMVHDYWHQAKVAVMGISPVRMLFSLILIVLL
ncbi:MAG: hypothetical protein HC856_03645 [Pseudanabaena sp. RU_4_16]|nr:hypothetical protein [Pseudanabaena sp. RU_4_16]